jgi:GrpB-like predicted nucleotidyltransferase (UPF0157 family)
MQFLQPSEYQLSAQQVYEELAARISTALPDAVVEHIGSSAVDEVVSKGDLDVFVGVEQTSFESCLTILEGLGFKIKEGSLRTESLCPFEVFGHAIDVGVQLVALNSKFEFFRTFLARDDTLREQYNNLKLSCAGMSQDDYRHRKSEFIEAFLDGHK